MSNITTCTTKKCYRERIGGDNLFCRKCRDEWKYLCITTGIHEKEVDGKIVNSYLKPFRNR